MRKHNFFAKLGLFRCIDVIGIHRPGRGTEPVGFCTCEGFHPPSTQVSLKGVQKPTRKVLIHADNTGQALASGR